VARVEEHRLEGLLVGCASWTWRTGPRGRLGHERERASLGWRDDEKKGWAGYLDWKSYGKRKFPFNDL
jgi:hypothetical protein